MNAKEELIIVIARQRVQTPLAPLTVHVTWDLKEVELYAMVTNFHYCVEYCPYYQKQAHTLCLILYLLCNGTNSIK